MKKCSCCKELKPISEFHRCKSTHDGLLWRCKTCNCKKGSEYRTSNSEKIKSKKKQYYLKYKALVSLYQAECGCYWCGESDPRVLHFDHVVPKSGRYRIGSKVNSPISLWKELEFCQILCANCHMIKTYQDLSYDKK